MEISGKTKKGWKGLGGSRDICSEISSALWHSLQERPEYFTAYLTLLSCAWRLWNHQAAELTWGHECSCQCHLCMWQTETCHLHKYSWSALIIGLQTQGPENIHIISLLIKSNKHPVGKQELYCWQTDQTCMGWPFNISFLGQPHLPSSRSQWNENQGSLEEGEQGWLPHAVCSEMWQAQGNTDLWMGLLSWEEAPSHAADIEFTRVCWASTLPTLPCHTTLHHPAAKGQNSQLWRAEETQRRGSKRWQCLKALHKHGI